MQGRPLQASFPDPVGKKKQEWSPIDRMLANKRGGRKSPSRKKEAAASMLPQVGSGEHRESPYPKESTESCQTMSWSAVLAEAVAPERQRIATLQADLKALKAQLKGREEGARGMEAREREEADRQAQALAALQAELERLREDSKAELEAREVELRAEFADERRLWEAQVEKLKREVANAAEARKLDSEDFERMRAELEKAKADCKEVRKKDAGIKEQLAAVSAERDALLKRLEAEQAEMIARVEALDRRMMSQKASERKSVRPTANVFAVAA